MYQTTNSNQIRSMDLIIKLSIEKTKNNKIQTTYHTLNIRPVGSFKSQGINQEIQKPKARKPNTWKFAATQHELKISAFLNQHYKLCRLSSSSCKHYALVEEKDSPLSDFCCCCHPRIYEQSCRYMKKSQLIDSRLCTYLSHFPGMLQASLRRMIKSDNEWLKEKLQRAHLNCTETISSPF